MMLIGVSLAVNVHQQEVGSEGLTKDIFVQDFFGRAVGHQTPVQAGGFVATLRDAG